MLSEISFLSLGLVLNNIPQDRQYPMTWFGTKVGFEHHTWLRTRSTRVHTLPRLPYVTSTIDFNCACHYYHLPIDELACVVLGVCVGGFKVDSRATEDNVAPHVTERDPMAHESDYHEMQDMSARMRRASAGKSPSQDKTEDASNA